MFDPFFVEDVAEGGIHILSSIVRPDSFYIETCCCLHCCYVPFIVSVVSHVLLNKNTAVKLEKSSMKVMM